MSRSIALSLTALLLLGACGWFSPTSPTSDMRYVVTQTSRRAVARAESTAKSHAYSMARSLEGGSWTYHRWGGALDLPKDFKNAATALGSAWWKAERVFPEDRNLYGVLTSSAGDRNVDLTTLDESLRAQAEAIRGIDAAYAEVVRTAALHGWTMPDSWLKD